MKNSLGRKAGILCHIASLPGKYGIGTLGRESYEFAEFLKQAHVKFWQILPLAQTGYGDSPYSSVCCNSGNPYFIDLEDLRDRGLLTGEELKSCELPAGDIDYGTLYDTRYDILRTAFSRFDTEDKEFKRFVESGEFDAYALFMSLKAVYGGTFDTFPDGYKFGEELALNEFREKVYKSDYSFWIFLQFIFKKQWDRLKKYVNSLGIKIIGDLPLYVAYDSADVWSKPELFRLDEDLQPYEVAGVPPDYFSPTGQLWGNPVYDWERMESDGYSWWINRIKKSLEYMDVIRIDHFRGLDSYYAIPAGAKDATVGEWKKGPGEKLFACIERALGNIPVIAEDLGVYDESVQRLLKKLEYPGMKVMLFAFDGSEDNPHLPANIDSDCVVYTGTHDNGTALGMLEEMNSRRFAEFKKRLRAALDGEGAVIPFVTREQTARALCVCVLASKADVAVLPIQDLLLLGDETRMNVPSTAEGNWRFRLKKMPTRYNAAIMRGFVKEYKR